MFNDLITTTEAYEGLVIKEEGVGDELRKCQARENNQLHLELIRGEDELGKR